MAGLSSSIIHFLPAIQQGVGLVSNVLSKEASRQDEGDAQKLALRQLQQQQAENMRQSQENAALDRTRIAAETEEAGRVRQAALKRAVACQRAQFGGSGLSSSGGSSEAVLLGLFDESDEERAAREKMDKLRSSSIDQGLDQQSRLNILQRTQFEQRQKVNALSSSVNRYSGYIDDAFNAYDVGKEAAKLYRSWKT